MVILLLPCFSCSQNSEALIFSADLLPPVLLSASVRNEKEIEFVFDEELSPAGNSFKLTPAIPASGISADGKILSVHLSEKQETGKEYTANVSVSDKNNNSLTFLYSFSGWNPEIPEMLINEINPRGSSSTPDCIEVYVIKNGNTGGVILTIGTEKNYSGRFVFPVMEVESGDYIIIHAKPEGIPEEINETLDKSTSGGKLANADAWDFWIKEAPGIPGNNGAAVIYSRKGGSIIDAVLWSDRKNEPDNEKLGWTSSGYILAKELGGRQAWKAANGTIPMPQEAVNASDSTATRSLCRASAPKDTDTSADWHTVPTRGQTFGSENSDSIYQK